MSSSASTLSENMSRVAARNETDGWKEMLGEMRAEEEMLDEMRAEEEMRGYLLREIRRGVRF